MGQILNGGNEFVYRLSMDIPNKEWSVEPLTVTAESRDDEKEDNVDSDDMATSTVPSDDVEYKIDPLDGDENENLKNGFQSTIQKSEDNIQSEQTKSEVNGLRTIYKRPKDDITPRARPEKEEEVQKEE